LPQYFVVRLCRGLGDVGFLFDGRLFVAVAAYESPLMRWEYSSQHFCAVLGKTNHRPAVHAGSQRKINRMFGCIRASIAAAAACRGARWPVRGARRARESTQQVGQKLSAKLNACSSAGKVEHVLPRRPRGGGRGGELARGKCALRSPITHNVLRCNKASPLFS
jgi:hypothetical protein